MLVLPFHQHVQVYLLVKTKNINLHQNHLQFSEKVVILKCFAILIVQVMADMPSNIGVKKECCHIIRTVTILCVGFKLEIIKRLVPFELIMAYLKVADWCHEYEFKFHQHQSYKKGIKLREFKQANLTIKKSHLVGVSVLHIGFSVWNRLAPTEVSTLVDISCSANSSKPSEM